MNLYLSALAVLGAVIITLSLVALIPNGMWFYLISLIFGAVALTISIVCMLGNE
jgi:hypothetical protein